MMPTDAFCLWLKEVETQVESRLQEIIGDIVAPPLLKEAMAYALLGGGKRLRPAMLMAVAQSVNPSGRTADVACAIECIHCYSLIHDDMPCMDDADTRRGRAACHRVYGDAIAMLAGDCLQPLAFEIIAASGLTDANTIRAITALAEAAGCAGMGGGQALDLQAAAADEAALQKMHEMKTGALFNCAAQLGLLCQKEFPSSVASEKLRRFAYVFGRLYQITNDIKDADIDAAANKTTYVTVLGRQQARLRGQQAYDEASEIIGRQYPMLAAMTDFIWHNKG